MAKRQKRIYLATPYTGTEKQQQDREDLVSRIAAEIMLETGYAVFSPISSSHSIAKYLPESTENWDFWMKQDLPFLAVCDELWVVMTDGTEESVGVRGEIQFATNNGMPVRLVLKNDDGTITITESN